MEEVEQAREEGEVLTPDHRLATTYRYNSLNQVITQHSPDGGFSRFWYDRLGRLVISQNAQQALDGNYSYTLYDQLGRITEVGQKKQEASMTDAIARNRGDLDDWLNETYTVGGNELVAEQVTRTVYDERDPQTSTLENTGYIVNETFQKSYTLRNRVSYTRYYDQLQWGEGGKQVSQYDNSTTYSYDIHGNVDTLLHDFRTGIMNDHGLNRYKAMAYKYDLISGKVNEVHYQPGWPDQFYHRYEYDADNKLTDVFTTDKKPSLGIPALEEHEARYSYYKHGPLARTVLGQEQVQGIDYAYTLQGWLKGVNSDSLLDKDGLPGMDVAKDAYRFSLNYFNGDYTVIGNAVAGKVFPGHSAYMEDASAGDYKPLYNGNISSMVVGIPQLGEMKLYNYGYDQLNRIVSMDTWRGYNSAEGKWDDIQKIDDYKERISYDANGNIKTYQRNGVGSTQAMDDLTYGYNKDGNDNIINNRLRHVKDAVSDGNYTEDIDNQDDDNYEYDAIGNLTKDTKEGISTISWTVYGKIKKITKTDGTAINYTYDVAGNRISKAVTKDDVTTTTWYSRDAQGNPLAIYTGTATSLVLSEQPLYGSSRLGVWNRSVDMDAPFTENNNTFVRGNKIFELSNHLGNVLVTISDRRLGYEPMDRQFDKYTAEIMSANDYYPFGMGMPGRKYSVGSGYRYGFNGKENDGETGTQDYGMRIYDPRVGRFLSVDPLTKKFPELTPFQFASNSPILGKDIDGKEFGQGWLIDAISDGFAELGMQRTSGFVRSYGHSLIIDPVYDSYHTAKKISNGQYIDAAKDFDPTGISKLPEVAKTGKAAYNGDKVAQGEVLGMLPGLFGVYKVFRAGIVENKGVAPENVIEKAKIGATEQATPEANVNPKGSKQLEIVEPVNYEQLYQKYRVARPKLRQKTINEVWEKSKDADGNVYDPNTGDLLSWDKFASRYKQWHMGHKPGFEYAKLLKRLRNGEITEKQFKDEYNSPNNYQPEHPDANMSHKYEQKTQSPNN